jgi:hypothetical protein
MPHRERQADVAAIREQPRGRAIAEQVVKRARDEREQEDQEADLRQPAERLDERVHREPVLRDQHTEDREHQDRADDRQPRAEPATTCHLDRR